MPYRSRGPPLVRVETIRRSAAAAPSTTPLAPSITQPPSPRRAVVRTSNRSNPDRASTQANASLSSPATAAGRMAAFCAAVPASVTRPAPSTTLGRYGSTSRPAPNASISTIVSTGPPPVPPKASGTPTPSQPRSAIWRQLRSL